MSSGNRVSFASGPTSSIIEHAILASDAFGVRLPPLDPAAIYVLFYDQHVTVTGFQDTGGACVTQAICAEHSSFLTSLENGKTASIKYASIPYTMSCPCCVPPPIRGTAGPSGWPGADAMVTHLAHELTETITDPEGNAPGGLAWAGAGNEAENADQCYGQFGSTYQVNGSRANQHIGGRDYLVQQNLVVRPLAFSCASAYDDPPAPTTGYAGCYVDDPARALPAQLGGANNTVDSCIQLAAAAGYRYAGLQWHGYCFAGNALGYVRVPDSECNTACSANPVDTCGGAWRNSVWNVANRPPLGYVDLVDASGCVWGWACDPDAPGQSVRVDFYSADGQGLLGPWLQATSADMGNEAGVTAACGGGGFHRFMSCLPPWTKGQSFFVRAIDLGDPGSSSPLGGPPCSGTLCRNGVLVQSDRTWRQTANVGRDDWTSLHYSDASWGAAVQEGSYGTGPWGTVPRFPAGTPAVWIWSYDSRSGNDSQRVYFRKVFTASGSAATLTLTADNTFTAYLNGSRVASGSDWTISQTARAPLLAGDNVLAVEVANGGGPGGLLVDVR